jgi:hypothetical protein
LEGAVYSSLNSFNGYAGIHSATGSTYPSLKQSLGSTEHIYLYTTNIGNKMSVALSCVRVSISRKPFETPIKPYTMLYLYIAMFVSQRGQILAMRDHDFTCGVAGGALISVPAASQAPPNGLACCTHFRNGKRAKPNNLALAWRSTWQQSTLWHWWWRRWWRRWWRIWKAWTFAF